MKKGTTMTKSFRLANNEGTITKLSGKRRRPYIIRSKTIYNLDGTSKRITIGYAVTQREAQKLLDDWNSKNLNLNDMNDYTFEVFFKSFLEAKKELQPVTFSRLSNIINNVLKVIAKKRIADVKYLELQNIINRLAWTTGKYAIQILKYCYNEALKIELVHKNIAELLEIQNKTKSKIKEIFSKKEIDYFWDVYEKNFTNNIYTKVSVSVVLIQLYSGCRVGEILKLRKENINLEERYFITGSKTDAGQNRIIPIHSKIMKIFEKILKERENKILLFQISNPHINTKLKEISIEKSTHSARHTFITHLQAKGVSVSKLKKLVGHKNNDITDGVYTHYTVEDLRELVEMIDY